MSDIDFEWLKNKLTCGAHQTKARGLRWTCNNWNITCRKRTWRLRENAVAIFPTAIFVLDSRSFNGDEYYDVSKAIGIPTNILVKVHSGISWKGYATVFNNDDEKKAHDIAMNVRDVFSDLYIER